MAESIKTKFPIFKKFPDLVYLDNAATTHRPESVIKRISDFYAYENSNIHRGLYDLSNQATQSYENAREKVASFLSAKAENIAFTKGTTESINIVANSFLRPRLSKGDNIVITLMEHHANFIPWQQLAKQMDVELRIVRPNKDGDIDIAQVKNMLDDKTRFISVVHISNTLGTINPIVKIIDSAHKKAIPVMIDAAQSAALYDLNSQNIDYDFLAFSGHKMFGPFGIGVLYANEKYLDEIAPYNVGGGMIISVVEEETRFKSFPYNMEAGTSYISGAIGLAEAIDFLNQIDREYEINKLDELTRYGIERLDSINGLHVLGNPKKHSGIISFIVDDIHPHDISSFLNKDQIAVRAGMHCTQPLLEYMGTPATVRASMSIYNAKDDIDRLTKSLKELIKFWS